jgi:pantothenate kinase
LILDFFAHKHNLVEMELNALEEGQKALLSDKTGEVAYIQSLQDRINVLKVSKLIVPLLA